MGTEQFYYVRSAAGCWHCFIERYDGTHWAEHQHEASTYVKELALEIAVNYPLAKCTIVPVSSGSEIPLEHQALSAGALKGQ
jgi:hypothetical protein